MAAFAAFFRQVRCQLTPLRQKRLPATAEAGHTPLALLTPLLLDEMVVLDAIS